MNRNQYCKSFCIPRVDVNVEKEYICKKLKEFNIGRISNIREIPLYKEPNYKRIIMKIEWDKESNATIEQIDKLIDTYGSAKLVYDMPWYWKITRTQEQLPPQSRTTLQPYRTTVHQPQQQDQRRPIFVGAK
jgi:hypothetical protein